MRQLRKLISLAILILVLMGCIKGVGWQKSFDNSSNVGWHKTTLDSSNTQNPTERIAVLKEIMRVEPPSKIVDAQYIEYQVGDNFLGPSDYRFYAKIVVEQRDIIKWRRFLQPKIPPEIPPTKITSEPSEPEISWWLSGQKKEDFEFYSPDKLSQRIHGFIAVSLKNEGIIYIYTHTV